MAYDHATTAAHAPPALPEVRRIAVSDLRDALAKGIEDFLVKPSHIVFIGVLYPVVGLTVARLTFGYDVLPLLFPLVAGFSLLGPVVAIGFYELSRRREQGLDASWWQVFSIFRSRSIRPIVTLGLVLMVLFFLWIETANLIYTQIFDDAAPASIGQFLDSILGTEEGLQLLLIGNAAGFVFAVLIFSISVVSFPLLLDKGGTAAGAVVTSIRAVTKNPLPMAVWAFIIAAGLFLGALPFFFGLAVVVPVLGHASWHLYRKVVVR